MRAKLKPSVVEAFCFSGTEDSAQAAADWMSSHDIENTELTWQTNSAGSTALDLTTSQGIRTLEGGEYLIIREGKVYAETASGFAETYEVISGN